MTGRRELIHTPGGAAVTGTASYFGRKASV
jgi:hypothetical protein